MDPTVIDEPGRSRFELRDADGEELLGWLDYRPAGESVALVHTGIAAAHGRKGLGGTLVRGALAQLALDGRTAIPTCPFAAAYIQRHPELVEHVAPSLRARFASS